MYKDFKITVLNMPKELRENVDKEVKEIRKMIYERNENANTRTEITKRSQTNSTAEKSNN